jgi:23S rRNA (cytidine1920-2'-O)/16S rRNA (cytidine1409-2'-O)-methyltransferase
LRVKIRLDKLLLQRGLVPSRERAQALILAGRVLVNDQKAEKAGTLVDEDSQLRLLGDAQKYVSRGGLKLERALEHWQIDLKGRKCMDVGASTGGFTDCMLQYGAGKVIAVDTGYGQIDARLRNDERVNLLERYNARFLRPEDLPFAVEFVAIDVSFISVTLVLPAVLQAAFQGRAGELVVLIKPQFEAGRDAVGKGGIVRQPRAREAAITRVT